MINVLWLPSWYPTIEFPQNGDFIFRHAKAASRFSSIILLYLQSSSNEFNDVNIVPQEDNGLIVKKNVFLNKRGYKWLNSFVKFYYYNREFKCLYKHGQLPDIIHVHVSYKAGLYALWLKFKYGIPYLVTEHWTFFTVERIDNYGKSNFLVKFIFKRIFRNSSYVLPVSENLNKQLKLYFPYIKSEVIPNVVDPAIFYYDFKRFDSNCFRFIHISSLNKMKNPLKIIEVFNKVKLIHDNVVLDIVGPADDVFLDMIKKLGLDSSFTIFHGLKEHHEVAEMLKLANAFVLFSDYETQSCVSIEALCCGVPVISSRLPCLEEFITEDNGILVPPGDEDALYNAMESMILNYKKYDRQKISETAQAKYDPDVVGKQIVEVYKKVLSKK